MFIARMIDSKRRWRAYKARVRQLPEHYRTALEAVERYMLYLGLVDAASAPTMFEDLADLFERAVADSTRVRAIVGDDPIEFVETFAQNYEKGDWITRERSRLVSAIAHAAGEDAGQGVGAAP